MGASQKSASPAERGQGKPVALSKLLDDVVSELGISRQLEECRAKLAWEEAVGMQLAQHAQPLRIKNRQLEVGVSSTVWSSQLSFMKNEILDRINHKVGSQVVTDLVFVTHRSRNAPNTETRTIGGSPKIS